MTKNDQNKIESVGWAEKFTTWVGSTSSVIVHTIFFIAAFAFVLFGTPLDTVLLVLTTVVSLEAIYLALFIQMTVNRNTQSLAEVEEDIDEIQEDVEEIAGDVEEIEKDIDEIQEDVEGIEKDIDEIQEDVDEIEKDEEVNLHDKATMVTLSQLQIDIKKLMEDIQTLKNQKK
jgi:peptidoglycan hydrolase CwlO-like protein